MSGSHTVLVRSGSSKHPSLTVKEGQNTSKPGIPAQQAQVLAQYHTLWLRIRNFEKDEQLKYRLRFLELEERGFLKPEQYETLLAKRVWHKSDQSAPAVLSFPDMYRAKTALAELDCGLRFADSQGACEGCTANNVRCEAHPRRQGFCMMHVSQAGKCKTIDQASKHRCEQDHEARDDFCKQHRVELENLLYRGSQAIESQARSIAEAQKVIDTIAL